MPVASRLRRMCIGTILGWMIVVPTVYGIEEISMVDSLQMRTPLMVKTVDKTEVLPGDSIRFTLQVRNVLLSVIKDAEISERFDPSILTVVSTTSAEHTDDGSLRWQLPRLGPGEVWEQNFVLLVSPDATHETVISTITTITGEDIQHAPLQEMVAIANISVVEHLPATGASYDLLFLLGALLLAWALTTLQRLKTRK